MNKFSGFLSTFLASLLAMVGIHLSAFSQVLNWSYEDIITDTYQSGANPEMIIDASGDIHISYWNKEEDRLMYGVRDKSTGSWTITPVTTGSADGYASALKLDPAGNVHIAYIVNQVGRAQLAYATNASGSWQTETITTTFDIGTYGTELVSPSYIQHSVDLTFQPNGDPAILFFDARINEIFSCQHPIREMYQDYELDLNLAIKQGNGTWSFYGFEDVPDLSGFGCLLEGDRFGEFCKIFPGRGGRYYVMANSLHNHDLLVFTSAPGDLTNWSMTAVDSTQQYFNASTGTFKEGFSFMDAKISGDSMLHIVYGMAVFYGYAGSSGGRTPFFYMSTHPDSLQTPGYQSFIERFTPNLLYRTYFSTAVPSHDNLYLGYYIANSNLLVVGNSVDRGETWVLDTVANIVTNTQTQMEYYNDSVFVAVYDAQNDIIKLYAQSTSGGPWEEEDVTTSKLSGNTLGSVVIRNSNDDEIYLAYTEGLKNEVFFSSRINNTWSHEQVSPAGYEAEDANLFMYQGSVPCVVYSSTDLSDLELAFKQGNIWQINTISNVGKHQNITAGSYQDTIYVAWFDLEDGHLVISRAGAPGGPWITQIIDSTSSITGRYPDMTFDQQGTLHVSYVDVLNSTLKYVSRPLGGNYTIETASVSFNYIPVNSSIKTLSDNRPVIAFRNSANSTMFLAEKDTFGIWNFTEIIGEITTQAGSPLRLIIDSKDKPWVLYNFVGAKDDLRLVRRDNAGNWHQVSVLNNQAEISTSFDFHLVESDFYIIGKKNQVSNQGLGMLFADEGVFTNLSQSLIEETFKVYPNPSKGEARLSFSLQESEKVSLDIYNLSGRKIHSLLSEKILTAGPHQFDLSLTHLPAGIYICRMKTSEFTTSKKWVIVP